MAKLELGDHVKASTMALRRILGAWSITALLAICASCLRSDPSRPKIEAPPGGVILRDAGATFPSPLYKEWFRAYQKKHPEMVVAYDAVGSGAGIKRFIGKSTDLTEEDLVDFAASDAAMTDAEIAEVHLSAISEKWRGRFGAVQLVDWPGATMRVEGNAGVSGRIKYSLGSIGYVELGFARRLGLRTAWLENKAGRFVQATVESGRAVLSSAQLPNNLRLFFPDPDGLDSYPIITLTWVLLYKDYGNPKKAAAVRELFRWCLTEGQKSGEELGYTALAWRLG